MADTGQSVERPSSMSAALESAAASAPAESSSSSASVETSAPTATSSATATAPVEASSSTTTTAKPTPGPVSYDRFVEVNTRAKLAEEQLQRYAWANGLSPDEVRAALEWRKTATGNPSAFLREFLTKAPPEHADAIRSEAARILAAQRASDPEPQPDLNTEVGPMRSPKNQAEWFAWRERQLKAEMAKDIAPIRQQLSTYQEREQAQQRMGAIVQFTDATVSDAKQWPHFETFKTEIAEAYKAMPDPHPNWSDRERAMYEANALQRAYITVLGKHGFAPAAQTQAAVVNDLKQRASAGTESGRGAVSTASKPKSMLAALEAAAAARSGHR